MKLIPLSQVSHALQPGVALPWGVRDGDGKLLLAKGFLVRDMGMLNTLLTRGMFVDVVDTTEEPDSPVPLQTMTDRWTGLEARLGTVLRSTTERYFLQRVQESVEMIAGLTQGNTDLLLFLILRHDHSRLANYGVVHSLHTAALCGLLSRRLGWSEDRRQSLLGAALTMNIAMLELQGNLASRGTTPTALAPQERQVIDDHPTASTRILREAGLTDEDRLDAVEHHHEVPGGGGYPHKLTQPGEMSQLLRFVDCFTAKHSPRAGRKPQPAHKAARELFTHSNGNPMAALIIKEFGIYPPGCHVKLASGEMAIVTQRGASANTPVVAAITNRRGEPMQQPLRRDTAKPDHAIVASVPDHEVMVRVPMEKLYDRKANQ
jgi:HD-GYP domain-containing protein (c-di-GMP phosphodiesterase class II)